MYAQYIPIKSLKIKMEGDRWRWETKAKEEKILLLASRNPVYAEKQIAQRHSGELHYKV